MVIAVTSFVNERGCSQQGTAAGVSQASIISGTESDDTESGPNPVHDRASAIACTMLFFLGYLVPGAKLSAVGTQARTIPCQPCIIHHLRHLYNNGMSRTVAPASVGKTMKHETYHLGVGIALGLCLSIVFHDWALGVFAFAVGMLVDADHMLDYLLYIFIHKQSFSLKEFLAGSYFPIWKKFITPLHSWELAAAALAGYLWSSDPYMLGFSLALAGHYLVDYVTNDVNRKAYFILFRLGNGFNKAAIKK